MYAENWRQLFNSTQLLPTKIYADKNWVMFVTEDETIHMMGRKRREDYESDEDEDEETKEGGDQGQKKDKYEDRPGTLREITKPEDCRRIKKIVHLNDLRLLLTEDGKLFLNGTDFDDVFTVEDGDYDDDGEDGEPDDSKCFKPVDIGGTFKMYKAD